MEKKNSAVLDPRLPPGYKPGLEDVVAGTSDVAEVNAEKDALIYRGYFAHELSEYSTYEEVAYLLLYGKLPSALELENFTADLMKERALPRNVQEILKLLPANVDPMVSFQSAITLIHMEDPDSKSNSVEANLAKAKRLIAMAPTIIATLHRINQGQEPVPPNNKLDHATNFLFMLTGKEPDALAGKIFSSTMILYAEHGYNASTFASLVTASTLSDIHSAVVSAIGTLKGPLHGGANEGAIEMLLKIGDLEKAETYIKGALSRKEKIMGFGHRVYRKQDSRAPFMKILATKMAEKTGDEKLFPLAVRVDEIMTREKNLFPNVDFYASVVYYLMGLPIEIYTPIFGMSRMAGWTAHVTEQHANNRLIRPDCVYTGPRDLTYVPIEKRS